MKPTNKLAGLVLIVLGLGAGLTAYAVEPMPGPDSGPESKEACPEKFGPGRYHDKSEMMEKHLTTLHGELKLTAEQEAAWNGWSSHVRKSMSEIKEQRPDFQAMEKLTAPEKMEKWLAFGKERQAKLEEGLAVTKKFYEALTAEQRQTFDKSFDFFRPGGWKGKHRPQG